MIINTRRNNTGDIDTVSSMIAIEIVYKRGGDRWRDNFIIFYIVRICAQLKKGVDGGGG